MAISAKTKQALEKAISEINKKTGIVTEDIKKINIEITVKTNELNSKNTEKSSLDAEKQAIQADIDKP